ncbi:MAG: DoxX family protein [Pseudomonadota bacterium]|nr:MAG: hypothetical protein DIU78_23610 [Pseudomonadota bacterium]
MKRRSVWYWISTGLVVFAFVFGGIADLGRGPDMVAAMQHLGYPEYLLVVLGVWKLLGAAAIVAPGVPRLKEWAYAGMMFDLTGAAVSHAAVGDPAANVIVPLVLLGLVAASWVLRPESRRLATAAAPSESVRGRREALAT